MSGKIIDYCVVSDGSVDTAAREVKELIDEGWEPWGSPFVDSAYRQAMVLRDNNNDLSIAMLATAFQSLADFHTKQSQG